MPNFLIRFLQGSARRETYYEVSKDGALVLNREGLLKSGKMDRQIKAARDLKVQALVSSRRFVNQDYVVSGRKTRQK